MAARQLRATPSVAGDLCPKQEVLLRKFDELFEEYQDQRKSLNLHILGLQAKYANDFDGLKDLVKVKFENVGFSQEFVHSNLETLFPDTKQDEVQGRYTISPLNFSFDESSLWRGSPPNHTVRKLARSMIVSGFRADSVISSRTLSFPGTPFAMQLGDGSARAIAAVIVWTLIDKDELTQGDEDMQHLVFTLSGLSVNFEKHGSGTPKETLIAQVSRQNQAAAVLPVSTMQWISMIRSFCGQPLCGNFKSTSQVSQVLEEMVDAYNKHSEVVAYDVDTAPMAKRKRRSKAGDDDHDAGLKVGRRRLVSMKSFLSGANDEILDEILKHIIVVGDYKLSAINDEILQTKPLFIGSKLGKDHVPSEAQRTALHAAGDIVKSWMHEDAVAEIHYDTPLTPGQFNLLWIKMIKSYEAAIGGLSAPDAKVRERASVDDWIIARKVVQLWDSSISQVAAKSLNHDDFEALKTMILESTTFDAELMGVLDRTPKYFHMGLIPAFCVDQAESVDAKTKRLAAAETVMESAAFEVGDVSLADSQTSV